MRGILTAATLLLASVFAPACSSGGAPPCDTPTAATTVEIQDNAFTPACVTATGGTTLAIENHDGVAHTFTVKDTDVNVQLDGNATQQASLAGVAAGTYEVLCTYHPEMRQTLQVS